MNPNRVTLPIRELVELNTQNGFLIGCVLGILAKYDILILEEDAVRLRDVGISVPELRGDTLREKLWKV